MINKIALLEYPLINTGVRFSLIELEQRAESFLVEFKLLIPTISQSNCDLVYELQSSVAYISLLVYLVEQPQLCFPNTGSIPFNEVAIRVNEELKKLPQQIRLLAFSSFSVVHTNTSEEDEKVKQLIRKRQNSVINLIVKEKPFALGFPEMAPYIVDKTAREIRFKIEYIHSNHLKIKLFYDSLAEFNRSKGSYLKIGNKLSDDYYFQLFGDALRAKPKKMINLVAYCYRDSVTNKILVYHIV